MKEINLLFVIYDLERGGPEIRLLDFAKYFPNDIKIHICVTSDKLALLKDFQKCNIEIKILPISRVYLKLNKIAEINHYVGINRISIVNSFDLKGLIISVLIKLFKGKRLRIVHHTVDLLHNYKLRHKVLLWFLLKMVNGCICNSAQSKEMLRSKFLNENKIRVINNGVDTSLFNSNSCKGFQFKKKHNIGGNKIVVGTIANFRKEKNYPFLLNAFSVLLKKFPNLMLLCVGGGVCLEAMKELAKKYKLDRNVIFTGYSENVAGYLGIMDIFVLCSLKEGFPNVIIQAMSMQVPVISSSVGGCQEIIDDLENGILFKPNDLDGFLNGAERLIEDQGFAAKLAQSAFKKVNEKYSLKLMINNYSNFYRNLYNRNNI